MEKSREWEGKGGANADERGAAKQTLVAAVVKSDGRRRRWDRWADGIEFDMGAV